MSDGKETEETKISKNAEMLRQVFEPLTAQLTPDVEPATIYFSQLTAPVVKTSHDD